MRAGGFTLHHTLTSEAAAVVRNAVGLARRRGHAQATPLHVAATLLTSDLSVLRRACLQSHLGSTHPLQWRALELCFNVALNRVPAAVQSGQPSLSNALIAALKRAQAHQRRGCIEQQQAQPLLNLKVEMEQLLLSILDDPSVSRVMREAGFYSTHVKNIVEETLGGSNPATGTYNDSNNSQEVGSRTVHLPWINKQQNGVQTPDLCFFRHLKPAAAPPPFSKDLKFLVEALVPPKRRNTVIVGEEAEYRESIVRQLMISIESGDVPESLKALQFIIPQVFACVPSTMDECERKIADLNRIVHSCFCHGGAIIYVGDLRWTLHENHGRMDCGSCYCPVEHVIMEVGKMVASYGNQLCLLGSATYETYLRCKMRQPSLESLWKLQPFTVAAGALSLTLHSSEDDKVESGEAYSWKNTPDFNNLEATTSDANMQKKPSWCSECSAKLELETGLLSNSNYNQTTSNNLPYWLRQYQKDHSSGMVSASALVDRSSEMARELRKKWNQNCRHIHKDQSQMQPDNHFFYRDKNSVLQDSNLQQQSSTNSSIQNSGIAPKFCTTSTVQNPSRPQCFTWSVMGSSILQSIQNSTEKDLQEDITSGSDKTRSILEVETTLTLGRSSSSDCDNNAFPNKRNRPNHCRLWWSSTPNSPESVSASVGNDNFG